MTELKFRDLSFSERGESIRMHFLKTFYFDLKREELEKIAPFAIKGNTINLHCNEKRVNTKFYNLLRQGFNNLRNSIDSRRAIYIHKDSGIPLIGSNAFGIVDRNTSCIEVKPITGCNLSCLFCSVDEGSGGKKHTDFVVEDEFLIEEFKKIAEFKGDNVDIEAHLNAQGEPLLYSRIVDLVKGLAQIKNVKTISIDTNGVLLSKELCNKLVDAGLTRFNISISAIEPKIAEELAGCRYEPEKVLDIARYVAEIADIIITPVWVPGINDSEISKLIRFAGMIREIRNKKSDKGKKLGNEQKIPFIGIQNFLNYPHGRNPVKGISMSRFREKLSEIEEKHDTKLLLEKEDFNITDTKKLPKPFKKGDVINAEIMCEGRLKNERIAVAGDRNITVLGCKKSSGKISVKIIRSKHNIFLAKEV